MPSQSSATRFVERRLIAGIVLFAMAVLFASAASPASAQTFTTLHTFLGTPGDGSGPFGGLVANGKGNYYGTTQYGGTSNEGTVFELSPPAGGGGQWTVSVISNFAGGTDGSVPSHQLVMDVKGNLFGTTQQGGDSTCGCGTVFVLIPPKVSGGNWTRRVLYAPATGSYFYGGLILDASGALYGTLYGGTSLSMGLAFKLAPATGGGFTETTLYNFGATGTDSAGPFGSLTMDSSGNLYGVSYGGGANALGTVYKLTPPAAGNGTWSNTVLYSFPGGSAGCTPEGNLILDKAGRLYGQATACGGTAYLGVIFRLTPPAGSGQWTESVLHTFSGSDGGGNYPSLTLDAKTNVFYGTSFYGGGSGVAFALKPPASGSGIWIETVLHTFLGRSDGNGPLGPLVRDANGVLYGTAYFGGESSGGANAGTIFSIVP